jgi:DNA-binding response OmpR family regulator
MESGPIRILLLEDEEQLREMLLLTLEEEGYDAVGVPSGEQALEEALNSSFDLVIADVKLTGMDGLDTLSELKKSDSELQSMVITGYATEADSIRAISLGVGHYMKKPFKLHDFLRAVAEISGQIREARKDSELRNNVNLGCLWILQQLARTDHGERADPLMRLAEKVESGLLAQRHSEVLARDMRLAVLVGGLGLSTLTERTPFLIPLLPNQALTFAESLEESPASLTEELKVAQRALSAWEAGGDELLAYLESTFVESAAEEGELETHDTGRLLALVKALEASGDRESASKVLSQIEEHLITELSVVHLNKAHLAWGQGEGERAESHLSDAETSARGVGERSRVSLEGGILLCEMNRAEQGLSWLQKAAEGFAQLNSSVDLARAQLALHAFAGGAEEVDPKPLKVLLQPNNLEHLFQSSSWLFPHLLSLDISNPDVRRIANRIVRNMPNLVVRKLKVNLLPESSLLKGLDLIEEAGTELYEEVLTELILNGDERIRSRASTLLRDGSDSVYQPTLRLYSLGMQRTWVGERMIPEKGWSGTKPRLLLTYLAQHPDQFVSQDQVVELFWDGSTKGRRNLNQTLVVIRQNLRLDSDADELDYVQRRGSTLGLNPDLPSWHDAAIVRSLLEKGQKHLANDRANDASDCLEQALQLDRGEYLEGHYEDWVLNFRDGLRRELEVGGQALADIRLKQNRPSEALRVAQHLLSHDPYSEQTVATMMRSYADLKNPVEAMKIFESFERRLKREMDLEPTLNLVRLFHQIKLSM